MTTLTPRRCLPLIAGLVLATGLFAEAPKLEFPAPSPACTLKQRVGLTDIEVSYSRPGMKGRVIFGGLVPYDEVWRTGANSATTIKFSTPVKLNGVAIPAGTYELFTIPGKTEWTVIIHKDMSEWGAYKYDPKNDVARITAQPFDLPLPLENFTINFNRLHDESALLELAWEKTLVPVKLEVDVVSILVPKIEAVMASDAAKKPYFPAAMFYLDHNLDLKQAAAWMDEAISGNPTAYYMIYRKALILAKAGDKAGAVATAEHSIELAKKEKGPASEEYVRLNETLIASLH
jgi:hypothetical protein